MEPMRRVNSMPNPKPRTSGETAANNSTSVVAAGAADAVEQPNDEQRANTNPKPSVSLSPPATPATATAATTATTENANNDTEGEIVAPDAKFDEIQSAAQRFNQRKTDKPVLVVQQAEQRIRMVRQRRKQKLQMPTMFLKEDNPGPPSLINFKCNLCFKCARNAVITICGHMYCWPCLWMNYRNQCSSQTVCPKCQRTLLLHEDIIPYYGGQDDDDDLLISSEAGMVPRPSAYRFKRSMDCNMWFFVDDRYRRLPHDVTRRRLYALKLKPVEKFIERMQIFEMILLAFIFVMWIWSPDI